MLLSSVFMAINSLFDENAAVKTETLLITQ